MRYPKRVDLMCLASQGRERLYAAIMEEIYQLGNGEKVEVWLRNG